MHLEAVGAGTRERSREERFPVKQCSKVECSRLLRGNRSEEKSQSNKPFS